MQFAELIEFTSLVVGHSGHLLTSRAIPDSALHAYWIHHRDLANQWTMQLVEVNKALKGQSQSQAISSWRNAQPLFRDILQTALVVRGWGAVLTAAGSYEATPRCEAIARNVLMTYLEVRKQCLELILAGADYDPQVTGRLNMFRNQTERWVDLLVGKLLPEYHVESFAIDTRRAMELGQHPLQNYLDSGLTKSSNPLWIQLKVMTSVKETPLQRCYGQLMQSIMSMFPHSAFNSQGLLRPVPLNSHQLN